jgi:uncharacterized protein YciI
VGQFALQFAATDLNTVAPSLRDEHARFLRKYKDALVTFGPIRRADGTPAGYAYQTDFPGTEAEGIHQFLSEDPFAKAGLYRSTTISGWRCALGHRQPTAPLRPELQGFFFHGIAKPNVTERRNVLADSHRAHLMPKDNTNCLARGGLTERTGTEWFGSAMVYEFPDRNALEQFFSNEPFYTGGIYERVDIYNWQRGEMAP